MITICAYCKKELNAHENKDVFAVPKNGDVGFCVYCGEFNRFMDGKMIECEYDGLDDDTLKMMKKITEKWELAKEDIL